MPLSPGTSTATFSHNVSDMVHAGHPLDQALAAAYREKRESRSRGGATDFDLPYLPENVRADNLARVDEQLKDIKMPPENRGLGKPGYADGGRMRSEATEFERARRELRRTPPVTVMEDLVGGVSPSKAQSNALRDAIRESATNTMRGTGYHLDPWGRADFGFGAAPVKPDFFSFGPPQGLALGGAPAPWQVRSEARSMMHSGPIVSAVPGRTDKHNMSVGSGSYVVPAQAVSHLGQSNTLAGMKVLNGMFGSGGPYGTGGMKIAHGAGAPKPPRAHAAGGSADDGGARGGESPEPVDVVTAGGEFVIPPESVAAVGGGDVKHGHDVLDAWVNSLLDDHIKTLKKLPGPAKS